MTAIGNDVSYDKIFSEQIENFAKKGDLLMLFSCSGTSKNIIKAAQLAQKKDVDIISFTGFKKSFKLKKFSKIFINLDINNYGVSEDAFQSMMHIIAQIIRIESANKKIKIL